MRYGYKKRLDMLFVQAVKKVKAELAKEGFGILTEIDVRATLKKKLNAEYDNYLILGACNPQFSYQVLQTEKDIGLLLPCNVIVYETGQQVFVSAILPTVAMGMVNNPALAKIAEQVEKTLKRVIDRL